LSRKIYATQKINISSNFQLKHILLQKMHDSKSKYDTAIGSFTIFDLAAANAF
jgi:DNA polymerase I-like protein with 3'-5' exonuclease and polymerase domains